MGRSGSGDLAGSVKRVRIRGSGSGVSRVLRKVRNIEKRVILREIWVRRPKLRKKRQNRAFLAGRVETGENVEKRVIFGGQRGRLGWVRIWQESGF